MKLEDTVLSDISQSQNTELSYSTGYELKTLKTQGMGVARSWGRGDGKFAFKGTELAFAE